LTNLRQAYLHVFHADTFDRCLVAVRRGNLIFSALPYLTAECRRKIIKCYYQPLLSLSRPK